MRENAREKALRYLVEGRLTIRHLDEDGGVLEADARGDGAIHSLGYNDRRWFCSCKARGRCCHLLALGQVVALEPRESQR